MIRDPDATWCSQCEKDTAQVYYALDEELQPNPYWECQECGCHMPVTVMKLIVAGDRNFEDYDLLVGTLNDFIACRSPEVVEVVSGTCRGTDTLGEYWAMERGFPIHRFVSEWRRYGKGAGPIRNREMAEHGTHLVAFSNGQDSGTASMIKEAQQQGLEIEVVNLCPACGRVCDEAGVCWGCDIVGTPG